MDISTLSDEQIVTVLQGLFYERPEKKREEEVYFNELFNRYSNQAYSFCRYYGLGHDDSSDVIQEIFFILYRKIRNIDPKKVFKPYFLKILMNLIRNRYQLLKKHRYSDLDLSEETASAQSENIYEKVHDQELVRTIINKLPQKLKEIVLLKVYGELSGDAIAETLGISKRWVFYRYKEALEMIEKDLGGSR